MNRRWIPFAALAVLATFAIVFREGRRRSKAAQSTSAIPLGFLRQRGMLDFAGGTVVHMSAGFAALAAAIVLCRHVGMILTAVLARDVGPIAGQTTTFVNHMIALVIASAFSVFASLALFKITDWLLPIRATAELRRFASL